MHNINNRFADTIHSNIYSIKTKAYYAIGSSPKFLANSNDQSKSILSCRNDYGHLTNAFTKAL